MQNRLTKCKLIPSQLIRSVKPSSSATLFQPPITQRVHDPKTKKNPSADELLPMMVSSLLSPWPTPNANMELKETLTGMLQQCHGVSRADGRI
ncbi:hypothetical protein JTE90_015414 [Oedothorax gibbosus]|uniref:Uncharacterized protein n=1 Tax=Oedothorax gibbosus TaxID=931172 RepID=A0AAV6U7M2_9ARAC|nr:hypothetical protein JTE90_015414 [Oedothorax gibbosus]